MATTKTLRRRLFSLAGRIPRKARQFILHLPRRWPWELQFVSALVRPFHGPLDAIPTRGDRLGRQTIEG